MVNPEEVTNSPLHSNSHSNTQNHGGLSENGEEKDSLFSPRFKSVAAMAGWDEEALLVASLIVEDTPDRDRKQKKRFDLSNHKSPLTNSRRKRRTQRRSPSTSMPVAVLSLDDDTPAKEDAEKSTSKLKNTEEEEKKTGALDCKPEGSLVNSSNTVIPCIDKLRDELSCAICLEICYEPSTTPCGHSFCKRCLRSAADKCGKRCPKCRQLISNGRSCTVNTVLWNTIQLLFPQEVEARKASTSVSGREPQRQNTGQINQQSLQNRTVVAVLEPASRTPNRSRHNMRRRSSAQPSDTFVRVSDMVRRRNLPSQDNDAALALRLQREEFMDVFGNQRSDDGAPPRSSLALARANLRAMASRATSIRVRGRAA